MDRVDCEQYKSGFYEIKGEVVVEFGVLKSRLVMCSATHISQTGSYTCYANNSIGNDAATAYVNIYGTYRWFMVFVFFAYNNSNLILMRSLSPWSSNVSPGWARMSAEARVKDYFQVICDVTAGAWGKKF